MNDEGIDHHSYGYHNNGSENEDFPADVADIPTQATSAFPISQPVSGHPVAFHSYEDPGDHMGQTPHGWQPNNYYNAYAAYSHGDDVTSAHGGQPTATEYPTGGPLQQAESNAPEQHQYAASNGSESSQSWNSWDSLETPEDFRAAYLAFDRVTSIVPTQIPVARNSPAVNNYTMARRDIAPLYRIDSRHPEVIFRDGFQPWNELNPPSLQYYQHREQETALVSTTRDGRPDAETVARLYEQGHQAIYQYEIWVPGGIDLMATLNRAAHTSQQEVIFHGGIESTYVLRAKAIDEYLETTAEFENENAHGATGTRDEYYNQSRAITSSSESSIRSSGRSSRPEGSLHGRHLDTHLGHGQGGHGRRSSRQKGEAKSGGR